MKFLTKSLVLFFFGILILSCDDFVNNNNNAPTTPSTDTDSKCLSVIGTRYEKYYYQLDPAFYNTVVTLNSPSVLGYEYSNEIDPVSYAFNSITLADVPLKRFTENTSFMQQVTGTIAVSGKSGNLYTAYSLPFEKGSLISPYRNYNNSEPLNVLNSFTNTPGDLVLSSTGDYSSAEKKQDFRIFSMALSSDFLKSCTNATNFTIPYGSKNTDTTFTIDGFYPSNLTATGSAYVSLIPVKRNFYQYKNVILTFAQGALLSDIETTYIVKDFEYNQRLNTLSITFNDYDFPYIGNVLYYKIKASSKGEEIQKSIRIEE
jgi:hypothetical protein